MQKQRDKQQARNEFARSLQENKHLPLASIHPQALPAARASWAALQQNQFWRFHDALFDRAGQLDEITYEEIAVALDLDLDRFNRDRASTASIDAIRQDLELADSSSD